MGEIGNEPPGRRPSVGEAKQTAGIAPDIAVQLFQGAIRGNVILTRNVRSSRAFVEIERREVKMDTQQ